MKRLLRSSCAALALAALVGGCATAPFSYVEGKRWHKATLDTYPVIILGVDGRDTVQVPAIVEPGMRTIRMQGPASPGFAFGDIESLTLDVQPCMRYYIVAQKPSPLLQPFTPKVDFVEPLSGCGPSKAG